MRNSVSVSFLADEPSADVDALFDFDFDIYGFIAQYPWILLIPVLAVWIGIHFGWKKLQMTYRMQGKPLRSLGTILKESFSVMYKEDNYPIVQFSQRITEKTAWLTWIFFWKWITLFTLVFIALALFGLISGWVLLASSILLVIIWLAGISHVKNVFGIRMHRLTQMFNVASSEARYESGAIVDLFSYIQVQEWLDVYHPQRTIVMFPTKYKSEDQRNRNSFETNFNGSVTDQNTWIYTWESTQNRVICDPIPFVPTSAPYPFPDQSPWNVFPLGLSANGEEAQWDVSVAPHLLVAGTTGSGKSVTQRTILLHALQSPKWRVVLIDPKRVELSVYKTHPHVLKSVTEIDESVALLEQLDQEMSNRYKLMQSGDTVSNHFEMLDNPPPAILLMVDETFQLLSPTGIKSDEGKEIDAMKARAAVLLSSIARLGRAAGIHMVLATQRPDAKVLPGELKANLDARIAQGRMDKIPSLMTLDSDEATKLPAIKGRAVFRANNDQLEFQAYFLAPEYLPEVLEMSAAIAQGNTDFIDSVDTPADMSDSGVEFVEPKAKSKIALSFGNPFKKLTEWIEKREAAIEEDNIRAGRTEEDRAKRDARKAPPVPVEPIEERKPEVSQAVQDPTLEDIAAQANKYNGNRIEPLFSDPQRPPIIDVERFRETVRSEDDVFDGDPSLEDFDDDDDWFDDDDSDDWGYESVENPAPAVAPQIVAPTYTSEPSSTDEDFGYVDELEEDLAENTYSDADLTLESPAAEAYPALTVQDVIARAAERGAPIPASELLAALQAEARSISTESAAPKPPQRPVAPTRQEVVEPEPAGVLDNEKLNEKPTSAAMLPNVIVAPPGAAIPTPPKNNVRDIQVPSDNYGMADEDNDEDFPTLNPLSAPWIPQGPVEVERGNSPFGERVFNSGKPEEKTDNDAPSSGPRRPKRG